MSSDLLVDARGLCRRYGPHLAVDGIDLQLRRGEVLGLLGPNGAGKTTTLRMLVGSLAPSAGSVHIGGVAMDLDPETAKRGLGYLPETPPLHPELTVREYLRFCARLHGVARAELADAVAAAQRACGLDKVARQVIGSLSKGYQQRVGLAQAIVHRPPVIVLDEPTVGLDPNQIREIRGLIAELASDHGIILSSHILPEVQTICHRVMIIAGGRCVYAGSVDAVRAAATAQTLLIRLGAPPALDALEALPGVAAVVALDGHGCFRLECQPGADHRAEIARRAVAWDLLEFSERRDSLEELFVRLTSTDQPPQAAA